MRPDPGTLCPSFRRLFCRHARPDEKLQPRASVSWRSRRIGIGWFRWARGRTANDNDGGELGSNCGKGGLGLAGTCVVEDLLINTQQSNGPVPRHVGRDRGQFGFHLEAAVAPSTVLSVNRRIILNPAMNRSTDGKGTFRWALRSPILMGLFTMAPLTG